MKKTSRRLASFTGPISGTLRASALALMLALAIGGTPSARATGAPPDRMTYQGFLVDGSGSALAPTAPVNYPIVFRIYDASDAGNLIWSEQQVVTVDKGNFSVILGEGAIVPGEVRPALSTIFAGATASDRYLGISVTVSGNTLNLLPRLRLLPSAYSFSATQATQLVNPSTGAPYVSVVGNNVSVAGTINATGGVTGLTAAQIPTQLTGPRYFTGGNVGVGTTTPNAQLSLGSNLANTKLALYDTGSGASYGLGIQASQFRFHLDVSGGRFSFLNGPAGSELLTIQGNGNVGVNVVNPTHKIEVAGSDAVAAFYAPAGNSGIVRVWDKTGFDNRVEFASRGNGRAAIWTGNDHFNVLRNGRVGIGTTDPQAPLEVRGFVNVFKNFTYYANGSFILNGFINSHDVGNIGQASGTVDYSILAERRVGASEFNAFSDRRIKDVVGLSDGTKDLDTISKLRVTDYYPVDKIGDGTSLKKGFIAQEVEAIIPEAVTKSKRFVPDIYALPKSFEYDQASQKLTIVLPKNHELKQGDRVQIFADESRLELAVASVVSSEKFVLEKCETKPAQVFVYGKEVNDFRTLNYDRIFTTGISAIQELNQVIQSKEARISSLEQKASRVEALENEIATLKKQLAANDEAKAKWEARFTALEKLVAASVPNTEEARQSGPKLADVGNH